ncbi:glycosyltransferase family 4 protein [Flavobacterium capsici]|uniref:Glycosyltransferase family 4 protein n=1 Tax=Flavobacterium capsici TaxID=3075618 RepID=A0AA96F2V5_9FLAO|nr:MULTISPECIES: glycosyltransferase family 4 protein [unclassified Flavobacterium]WNM20270.1 glycosyltransferase family 4 protein [Flavobacterium sp. PMR2A8]WNM21660.1 glycosyltransferase family 4 protein [Flavobacterium sp. PMTSA4]
MKKILYIGNKLSKHGNTATSIETLGEFLEKEGYVLYYASSKKVKVFRMLDMIYKTFKHASKVDYVLIDTYSTYNFWFAFIISQLCRVLGVKYISKLHGGDLPNRLKKSTFFCNLIFNNSYANVAPSAYLFNRFNDYKYIVKYIPNTIEIDKYNFLERSFDYPRLLWVRSFSTIYNPILAVKTFMELKVIYPNAELCMVGPKKDESYEQTIEFAKKNNVEILFTGRLSKKSWIKLSKKYNIFINTTHFDNTPISVIEAMALGLPVVSTNVGGIPYLLEHDKNALLVDDNDLEAMVNEIKRLFNEPDLPLKLTHNAKNLISEFDWEIVKNQWKELLQ